ncbi:hypothetical protein GCM10009696_14160 [Kocuria himachalensis]
MRVVVFGADTLLGREVVTDLIFRGHLVTAVAAAHPWVPQEWVDRVVLRTGDPLDAGLVDDLAAGHEVFVDALGDCRGGRALERSAAATREIAAGMQRHGRLRYIGLRPDVLLEPASRRLGWRSALRLLALGCCPRTRQAVASAFETVARSPLSWTVVRCPGLTHGPPRGVRQVGMTHRDSVGPSLTRADAARFLAAQVLETNYICAAPAISN